jgi:hypothetical protein
MRWIRFKKKKEALFEKSAQKLLLIWATGVFTSAVQIHKSFLVLFFKKEPLA